MVDEDSFGRARCAFGWATHRSENQLMPNALPAFLFTSLRRATRCLEASKRDWRSRSSAGDSYVFLYIFL
eukprot:jgi/Chrpa1/25493/Chrysochromulina_OHIO_Genome00009572-RA